ncbi:MULTISPECIES: FecR family protein [Butyricimonas]|uniref:FecR family protein n=1 Tax=Butyricimonas TaxID=574697 RepID=UPI001D084D93|nr:MULTISPECIES: FecR family protein [Butyricimonas]MCB6972868.1 FecR domain-containing protein [Butyricimonas synergistica]MCG4518404.1 FecR domain-containing protein [Butyricimonas sp. DFI.6.44]
MKTDADKYLNRPIGENEDELLDEIWNSLPEEECEEHILNENYQDVKSRIRQRRNTRRMYWISGSVAAACVFVFLFLLFRPTALQDVPVYAQLDNMGVSVCNEQVQLIVGDSAVSNLGSDAKINVDKHSNVALQSADGKKIMLQEAKVLKIYVPSGKHFNLELTDGTRIVLNADTWFEYPSTFDSQSERRVKINGEGFFEVKSDTTKPFYVEIPNGESIRVLGTCFNVSAYEDNTENVTTLLSGKIAYHVPANNQTVTLSPNEQIRVDKGTNTVKKHEVDAAEYAMWKEGVIYFNNEKLSVLAKKLSRMYGIDIQVSEEHHDSRFSGMIRHERGIDYITRLVTTTSNIKCIIENGIIYLK